LLTDASIVGDDVMVTADGNGPVVQHWNMATGQVRGFELPREFLVERLTIR